MFRPTSVLFRSYRKQHQPMTQRKKRTRRVMKQLNARRAELGLPALRRKAMKRYDMNPWKLHQTDLNTNALHLEKWITGRQVKIKELQEQLRQMGAQL